MRYTVSDVPGSYGDAARLLNDAGKSAVKIASNTDLIAGQDKDGVPIYLLYLHDSLVAAWYRNGQIAVSSAGCRTVTMKDRINRALGRSGYVRQRAGYQSRGQWLLIRRDWSPPPGTFKWGKPEPFFDGITVEDRGQALSYHYEQTSKPDGPTAGHTGD